jgi:hypothetical protein
MATKADVLEALRTYKAASDAEIKELHQFDDTGHVPKRADTERWYQLHLEADRLRQHYHSVVAEWRESLR